MKVSFIMQAYLGKYPGSRSNADKKFLRAVKSFIDQNNKNSELIIVSDGCDIVHRLYFEHFKQNDRVKYAFVDKDTPKMYEENDGNYYYRGFPRQIGIELADGDVIAYMDSDDYLMKYATDTILIFWKRAFKAGLDAKWALVNSWVDHSSVELKSKYDGIDMFAVKENIEIPGIESTWSIIEATDPSFTTTATWSITHIREDINVKWKDIYGPSGISEDKVFAQSLEKKWPGNVHGFTFKGGYYVRLHCHDIGTGNNWDY